MRKQAVIASFLCLLMFAGLASLGSSSPGTPPRPTPVTAKVFLNGTIQLGWYNWTSKTVETYNLNNIKTNFTAMVPPEITPGLYNNATFQGYACVSVSNVELYGFIQVNATGQGFMAQEVTIPNNWPQVPMGGFEANGTIEITITLLPSLQYTMVHLVGPVTQYGTENATGWMSADAMITNVTQRAKAHILWMPAPKMTPGPTPKSTNFTYSFYAASLINASTVSTNRTGYDFYVNGTWTVYNVTFTYYGQQFKQYKENVTVVAQTATGDLAVPRTVSITGLNFTVSIVGFDEVKGSVWRLDIYHRVIPEWNLDGDITSPNGQPQGKVTFYDLVAVARHVGETPGCGQGSCSLQEVERYDVNFDFQVDVYSLVTVATEMGP